MGHPFTTSSRSMTRRRALGCRASLCCRHASWRANHADCGSSSRASSEIAAASSARSARTSSKSSPPERRDALRGAHPVHLVVELDERRVEGAPAEVVDQHRPPQVGVAGDPAAVPELDAGRGRLVQESRRRGSRRRERPRRSGTAGCCGRWPGTPSIDVEGLVGRDVQRRPLANGGVECARQFPQHLHDRQRLAADVDPGGQTRNSPGGASRSGRPSSRSSSCARQASNP